MDLQINVKRDCTFIAIASWSSEATCSSDDVPDHAGPKAHRSYD